ncbi:alpha/beta hydrolase fold domain-containing protein [Adlercreutzia sp. ZJ138]|uniref:alpha/beta hydrolase fold domain-containing protein n=1 Tax=Adlercreutzia sp. ZJ138 TaxID=2709405 RepID=UPI0013ECA449|nr:alpha/beta hydrolase [Adlercreutzia sp. ZJ138]
MRSSEATAIYDMFIRTNAKAPWSEPVPFAQLVETCREEQRIELESGYEPPAFLRESMHVERSHAADGTLLVTVRSAASAGSASNEHAESVERTCTPTHVLYFHGGAFFKRISDDQWRFCQRLVERTGCELTACIYPLAPTHRCAETLAAATSAYEAACARAEQEGARLVLFGDSAGGSLAVAVAQLAVQRNAALPDRILAISPFFDMVGDVDLATGYDARDPLIGRYSCQQIAEIWAEGLDPRSFPPDPLYGPKRGLPPMLVIGGEHEIMLSGMRAFAAESRTEGCQVTLSEYEGMWHIFPFIEHLPESQRAFEEVAAFIA